MLKVGDRIIYRPGFGNDAPRKVTIKGMEETEEPREKYGVDRKEVPWATVVEGRVCFDLSDGHWSYSDQVDIEASKGLTQGG